MLFRSKQGFKPKVVDFADLDVATLPKAGKLVMFPSWLMHQVRPYKGSAVRISIAMNLAQ